MFASTIGRVLAVDDDLLMRELLTSYLERAGYSVTTASSGEQALSIARGELFDAIILDVNMPGMSGVALANALRGHPATRDSKIAMHTSDTEGEVRTVGFGEFDAPLPSPSLNASFRPP
jgi:two-component system chemotaxis sensor kinase CheA